jgi:predicted MFS family arabinose efflux permease
MSFVNLLAMSIAIALIRVRPTSPEAGQARGPVINKAVVGRSEFWSIALSLLIGVLGYGAPFIFLTQWVGQHFPTASPMTLTAPLTILSFCVCVGRSVVGWAADYVGAVNTYILVLVLSGVVQFALWLTASSYGSICAFGVMYGLIAPGYLGLLPQIVVTLFGPGSLASNTGLLLLFNAPGNLVSGPLGGALYDLTGGTSFKYTIIILATLQVVGGLLACWGKWRENISVGGDEANGQHSSIQDRFSTVCQDISYLISICGVMYVHNYLWIMNDG